MTEQQCLVAKSWWFSQETSRGCLGSWLLLWLNANKWFHFLLERSVLLLLSRGGTVSTAHRCGTVHCLPVVLPPVRIGWVPVSSDAKGCGWQSHSHEAADTVPCERKVKLELGISELPGDQIRPWHCLSTCLGLLSFFSPGGEVLWFLISHQYGRETLSPLTLPPPYLKKTFDIYTFLSISPLNTTQ